MEALYKQARSYAGSSTALSRTSDTLSAKLDGGLLPGATGPNYVTTAGSCATVVAPSSAVARRIALLNEPALPPPWSRVRRPRMKRRLGGCAMGCSLGSREKIRKTK